MFCRIFINYQINIDTMVVSKRNLNLDSHLEYLKKKLLHMKLSYHFFKMKNFSKINVSFNNIKGNEKTINHFDLIKLFQT